MLHRAHGFQFFWIETMRRSLIARAAAAVFKTSPTAMSLPKLGDGMFLTDCNLMASGRRFA